jgi:hypothetical protein
MYKVDIWYIVHIEAGVVQIPSLDKSHLGYLDMFVCLFFDEGAITTYFKRLRFDAVGKSGARTHDLPDASLDMRGKKI